MDGVRHSRGEGVGAGWGRLPRSVQLGVDRDADGDLLFDVFVAVRILCGEEFRGAGLDDAGGANSGGDAHAQGVLHYRKNGEQLRGAGLHGAGVDGGGAGDAMGASRSEADFIMAVVVAVPADCAASNVHNGQRRVAFRDRAGVARRRGQRDLFLSVDVCTCRGSAERFRRSGGSSRSGEKHAAGDGESESGECGEFRIQLDDWRRAGVANILVEWRRLDAAGCGLAPVVGGGGAGSSSVGIGVLSSI